MKNTIDISKLASEFRYCAETGKLFSTKRRGNLKEGCEVGWITSEGYRCFQYEKQRAYVHRAIFAIHHGFWPEYVDHINGNKTDNRIENLRAASLQQNNQNAQKRKSRSRFRGVSKRENNVWEAYIQAEGKLTYVGRFKDEVEAAYAYDMASLKYQREFGRRNFLPLVL